MPVNSSLQNHTVNARDFCIALGENTKIMGILNVSPDSFSNDGLKTRTRKDKEWAIRKARQLVASGADILDIGGESSRPGATQILIKEEIRRVIPVLTRLTKFSSIPISVDTHKPLVAQHALDAGAHIINNIKGTTPNTKLLKMVRDYDAALVLMHIRGTPKTMQKDIKYDNVIKHIFSELKNAIENCLEIGIKSDKIIIDPGIGFGKTVEHNLEIIARLSEFKRLGYPILIGTSRKSFIGKTLNKEVDKRLNGTIASVVTSVLNGADIVRVHDVRQVKEALTLTDRINKYQLCAT